MRFLSHSQFTRLILWSEESDSDYKVLLIFRIIDLCNFEFSLTNLGVYIHKRSKITKVLP